MRAPQTGQVTMAAASRASAAAGGAVLGTGAGMRASVDAELTERWLLLVPPPVAVEEEAQRWAQGMA
jgi:hypothetical protein